jgi:hypothetical protein
LNNRLLWIILFSKMIVEIFFVDIVDIHVFDISHEIWLLLRFILIFNISFDKDSPTCTNVNFLALFFFFLLFLRLFL